MNLKGFERTKGCACVCDDIDNIGCLSVAIRIGYPFISAKVVWVYKLRKNILYMAVKRDPDTHFAVRVFFIVFPGTCFPKDDGNIMEQVFCR